MSVEDRLYPLLPKFQSLPDWVQSGVAGLYRMVPSRWRIGKAYHDFRSLINQSMEWSEEELRDYQTQQLRKVLVHAGNYCPYYQSKFAKAAFRPEELRTPEDLTKCPLLEKSEIQQHLREMVSTEEPNSRRLYMTTGGSTG